MASRLEIFQLVAQHLGQDQTLVDPDENLPLAGLIRAVWDVARKATLRGNIWNFATNRVQIAADAAVPAFGFSAQFTMPPDFIRIADVMGMVDRGRDWTFENGKVLANVVTLYLRYVFDNQVPETWSDQFALVLSYKIAEMIAVNVTGDENLRQGLAEMFKMALAEAQANDGQENPPITFDQDTWVMARYGAGGGSGAGGYHPSDW